MNKTWYIENICIRMYFWSEPLIVNLKRMFLQQNKCSFLVDRERDEKPKKVNIFEAFFSTACSDIKLHYIVPTTCLLLR
jgi:hypothetical protein